MKKFGYGDFKIIAKTNGKNLENKKARHPFIDQRFTAYTRYAR
jgi:hypothetical protein